MIKTRHIFVDTKANYRCIVISDVHSHCDRLKMLLKQIHYCQDDYLIINGDFTEKGTQGIETLLFLQKLQSENDKVYILLGNCEYALETLVSDPAFAQQMFYYLQKIGKSGLITQAISHLKIDMHTVDPIMAQEQIREYLSSCLAFIRTLPTTLETKDFLFVHAGIEKRNDWKNGKTSSFIEMRSFQRDGHLLDKYVIVGHLPTSNFYESRIDNDIIIDQDKKIISLDGGTGVKMISQLNALIIHGYHDSYDFECEYVQPLPRYIATNDVIQKNDHIYKIAWPFFAVDVLKKDKEFSLCQQKDTGHIFAIKNEFLYQRNGETRCLDDYINYRISLKKGETVALIGIYGSYAYVKKGKEIGWVPACFVQPL